MSGNLINYLREKLLRNKNRGERIIFYFSSCYLVRIFSSSYPIKYCEGDNIISIKNFKFASTRFLIIRKTLFFGDLSFAYFIPFSKKVEESIDLGELEGEGLEGRLKVVDENAREHASACVYITPHDLDLIKRRHEFHPRS